MVFMLFLMKINLKSLKSHLVFKHRYFKCCNFKK
ncbi:hypothetical protein N201_07400 [Helicobacter pylori UM066]|nr:hypothetical protein N201_07400 [Helicobacter pylori UM066]